MSAKRALLRVVGLLVAAGGGWAASRVAEPMIRPRTGEPAGPTPAQYRAATVTVRGSLGAEAYARLRTEADSAALLVVLHAEDLRACEDLGRQLREVRAAFPAFPLIAVTEPASISEVQRFLRRERLPASVAGLRPELLVAGHPDLATPAVLRREGGGVVGTSHPLRFQNVRVRSFAAELGELR